MARSSFDRVKRHLRNRGAEKPVPEDLQEDLEILVRRCDEVRTLGRVFGSVELSPYMKTLLGVSRFEGTASLASAAVQESSVAAGS